MVFLSSLLFFGVPNFLLWHFVLKNLVEKNYRDGKVKVGYKVKHAVLIALLNIIPIFNLVLLMASIIIIPLMLAISDYSIEIKPTSKLYKFSKFLNKEL